MAEGSVAELAPPPPKPKVHVPAVEVKPGMELELLAKMGQTVPEGPHTTLPPEVHPTATPLPERGEEKLNAVQDFIIRSEELPIEIREKARTLAEKGDLTDEELDKFIAESKAKVPDEQKPLLDELKVFTAQASRDPEQVLGALEQYAQNKASEWSPDKQQQAQEMLEVMHNLKKGIADVEGATSKGPESLSAAKGKMMMLAEKLKNPIKYLMGGIVGFFMMFIFRGIKSIGGGGGQQGLGGH